MNPVRFIHCADLHIGTPFKGISDINPDLGELLCLSTYQSFTNIVDLAINKKVDCVVIAGDIYDSSDKSLQAQLRFRNNLKRLSEAQIPTFIAYGNHDPLDGWSATLEWPSDVFIFPGDRVECYPLIKNGETIALVYGISFPKRDVYENLALKFTKAKERIPSIGLLHTNIGTNTGHIPYAPCNIEDLAKARIDYWALGHVHKHTILKIAKPAIVYSGCSQSKSPREVGSKGCCLVTIESSHDPIIEFLSTDLIRYKSDYVDISCCSSIDEILNSVIEKCKLISSELDERSSIVRLALIGRTDLHKELQKGDSITGILENVREYFAGTTPCIWLEKLIPGTTGVYDLDILRSGNDFTADIISIFDVLGNIGSPDWTGLRDAFEPLFSQWQGCDCLEKLSDEQLLELANEARSRMLDMLIAE